MTDHLAAIESALAHAEMALDDLSAELLRQGGEIDALKAENRNLQARLRRIEDRLAGDEGESRAIG
jgi:uncharacterized coiled-coil protein SlyX